MKNTSKLLTCYFSAALSVWALGLDELVNAACEQHPSLEYSRGSLESGRIQEDSLPWWDAPEVRMGYGRDTNTSSEYRSDRNPDHQYQTSLRVFPKNPWERRAEHKKLNSANRLLELSVTENEHLIETRVKELFWECAYSAAELEVQQQLLEVLVEQEGRTQALLESGQITVGQSLPARMKRMEVAMDVESLQRRLEGMKAALASFCGVEQAAIQLAVPEPLEASDFELPYGVWQDRALKQRTDVQRYGLQAENAKAELDTLKARDILWVKHVEAAYRVRGDYGDRDAFAVELAFELPFFASDAGEERMVTNMLKTHNRQASQARRMAEVEVRALIAEFQSFERQWQLQGDQIQLMQEELSAAISKMESQGGHANESYWDARVSLLSLELKKLELSEGFQNLLLKAETVLDVSNIHSSTSNLTNAP